MAYHNVTGQRLHPFYEHTRTVEAVNEDGRCVLLAEVALPVAVWESDLRGTVRKPFTLKVDVQLLRGDAVISRKPRTTTVDTLCKPGARAADCLRECEQRVQAAWSTTSAALRRRGDDKGMQILVVGCQHVGKSSLVNSFLRLARQDTRADDLAQVAPSGINARTPDTKYVEVSFGPKGATVTFVDTPHLAEMGDEGRARFRELLRGGVPANMRWQELLGQNVARALYRRVFQRRADGVLVVVSLEAWEANKGEVQRSLQSIERELNNADDRAIVYPYVVVATHRDAFLKSCQDEFPLDSLQKVTEEIARHANTDKVFTVSCIRQDAEWSAEVIQSMGKAMSSLLTFAQIEDTNRRSLHTLPEMLRAAVCRICKPAAPFAQERLMK